MKQVKYKDTYIYIDDSEVKVEETGIMPENREDLEKTHEIEIKDSLEDTLTDIWSDKNGQ